MMGSIEVLVATMDQTDLSKYHEMNIRTDALFANQSSGYGYIEETINGNRVRMITTRSKGVGVNRNSALLHAAADICLLSDDDMIYYDDYPDIVNEAFNELPDADMIIFNIHTLGDEESRRRVNNEIKRVRLWNFLNYGAPRIALRRSSIMKSNIWFSLLYGGGAIYSSGEDNLFLRDALKKNLKVYAYPQFIGAVRQYTSSWFSGYDEKYFFDKGALLSAAFPVLKYAIGFLYYPWRFKNRAQITGKQIRHCIMSGMKAFSKNISYNDWLHMERKSS